MPTFRILDQAPQYLLPDGSLNAGGSLTFYETNLTDLQDTWSDPEKNTLNPNPVVLDAEGRTETDVWGDGEYGVVLKDADGVTIWTRNNVEIPGGQGTAIPALVNGQFLSNDGSNLVWQPVLQVPDPTGLANYVLTSDGTGVPVWQQQEDPPTPADPDIVVGTTSFLAGLTDSPTKFDIRWGTATAPPSGSHDTSVAIEFDPPFKETPAVFAQIAQASICPAGLIGCTGVSSTSINGATINVDVNDDDDRSQFNIISSVALMWVAIGRRDVEEEP